MAKAESQIEEMTVDRGLLQEKIKQLQNEITTYKQARVVFEQKVSELAAENEKLQCELTNLAKAESKITETTSALEQLQKEEPRVEQISEHQNIAEQVVETPVRRKITKRNKIYEQQHRTVEGVRQKRCCKCNEWKPESEFHKNSSSRDNLAATCKICKNTAARERRRLRNAAKI